MNNQEYQGKMESQLRELGEKIDELTEKAAKAAQNVKQGYYENIDMLRSEKDTIQSKVQELKNSSGEAWEEIKTSLDKTWDEVQGDLKKSASRFQ